MSLTESNINSLRNVSTDNSPNADSILNDVSSAISNPIGGKLNKLLFKINGLTTSVESKIDALVTDTKNQSDNRATVQLVNNTLVVSSKPEDARVAQAVSTKIQNHIHSINGSLNQMNGLVGTLSTIAKTTEAIQKALEVQEALLSINPVTKATFSVFKKAIKIVFLKDMMKQYTTIISLQLAENKKVLSALTDKFHQLHVQTVIGDKNNTISQEQAEEQITQTRIANGVTVEVYTALNGKEYVLDIRKYDARKLYGRAYDRISGMTVTQTSPSIVATSDELMDELKRILDAQ